MDQNPIPAIVLVLIYPHWWTQAPCKMNSPKFLKTVTYWEENNLIKSLKTTYFFSLPNRQIISSSNFILFQNYTCSYLEHRIQNPIYRTSLSSCTKFIERFRHYIIIWIRFLEKEKFSSTQTYIIVLRSTKLSLPTPV